MVHGQQGDAPVAEPTRPNYGRSYTVFKVGGSLQVGALFGFVALWQLFGMNTWHAAWWCGGVAAVGMVAVIVSLGTGQVATFMERLGGLLMVGAVLGGLIAILVTHSWQIGLWGCVAQFLLGAAILIFTPEN